jgi:succinyl-diaminopimelate desuccinylase
VLGTKKGSSTGYVLFAAHFDVVPVGEGWESDPWTPTLSDGKLYGRGSSDDKGAIAAFLEAMRDLTPTIGAKALFTCDEEIGGNEGLGYVTENCKSFFDDVRLAWIADSATTFVGIGSSGVLGGKITVHGLVGMLATRLPQIMPWNGCLIS